MISKHLIFCHPLAFNLCQQQGLFQWIGFFTSGGQSIGASAAVLLMNIRGWFPLELTGLILQSKGLWRVFSCTVQKHQFFCAQPSFWSSSHMTTGKTIALTIQTFAGKVLSLPFTMLSMFVIAFLPRSKHLFISQLHSSSTVILEPRDI